MWNVNKNLKVIIFEKDRKIKCLNDRLYKMLFEKISNFDFFISDYMNLV